MRIVGGEFRGRALRTPKSTDIRPTTDRTRESLFNILMHSYPEVLDGGRVMDLFAGTGAVGIEALSRGCSFAIFVEMGVEGRGLIRENTMALNLQGRTKLFRRDATDMGTCSNMERFGFLFVDPPYGKGSGEKAIISAINGGWLSDGALVVLEERADIIPTEIPQCDLMEERSFGETKMHFYSYKAKG